MTPAPARDDQLWTPLEVGQLWGLTHGTVWLAATLQVPQQMVGQPVALQLLWDVLHSFSGWSRHWRLRLGAS